MAQAQCPAWLWANQLSRLGAGCVGALGLTLGCVCVCVLRSSCIWLLNCLYAWSAWHVRLVAVACDNVHGRFIRMQSKLSHPCHRSNLEQGKSDSGILGAEATNALPFAFGLRLKAPHAPASVAAVSVCLCCVVEVSRICKRFSSCLLVGAQKRASGQHLWTRLADTAWCS